MPSNTTYRIEITEKQEEKKESGQPSDVQDEALEGTSTKTIKGKGWKSGMKKATAIVTLAGIATQTVFSQASRDVHRYYQLEEDYKGNQNASEAQTILNDVASVGATAITAGIAGFQASGGNIAGAIAGAAAGLALGAINASQAKTRQYLDAAYSINEANYQNYFRGTRAGLVGGSQNTEN